MVTRSPSSALMRACELGYDILDDEVIC